jgi:hypothetical protein
MSQNRVNTTLEQRVATAFSSDITSADLDLLIQEVEMAASAADQAVQRERKRAFDPAVAVDPNEAREAVVAAEFQARRSRKAVLQLQARLQQIHLHERYSRWLAEFERVKPRHDAAVARLQAVYVEFQGKLVDALNEAQGVDAEVKRLSSVKPYDAPEADGDGCHLLTVEMAARGITGIGLHGHSIMKDLKLPDFADPTKVAWPPPTPPLAAQFAASMMQPSHMGPNWHEEAERARALREEHERAIARSLEMARQRAEREAAAAEERARAKQMARTGTYFNRSGVCLTRVGR